MVVVFLYYILLRSHSELFKLVERGRMFCQLHAALTVETLIRQCAGASDVSTPRQLSLLTMNEAKMPQRGQIRVIS